MRKEILNILKVVFIILCVLSTKIQSSAKKVGGKPDRLGMSIDSREAYCDFLHVSNNNVTD